MVLLASGGGAQVPESLLARLGDPAGSDPRTCGLAGGIADQHAAVLSMVAIEAASSGRAK